MTKRTDIPHKLDAAELRCILGSRIEPARSFTTLEACYIAADEGYYGFPAFNEEVEDGDVWYERVRDGTNREDMVARLLEAGFVPRIGKLATGEAWIEGWKWP